MSRTYYVEEIQDPTTGERITVQAETEAELDRRVEEQLGEMFPTSTLKSPLQARAGKAAAVSGE